MKEALSPPPFVPSDFLLAVDQLCIAIPASIIILNAPLYISKAFSTHRGIELTSLLFLKLGVVGVLSTIQINSVFQWWDTVPVAALLPRATAFLSYVSMPCLAIIVSMDHLYSIPPTLFLSAVLFITLLVDVTAFPTYFYVAPHEGINEPNRVVVILKLLLLILEQIPKPQLSYHGSFIRNNHLQYLEQTPLWSWAKTFFLFGFFSGYKKEQAIDPDFEAKIKLLEAKFVLQWAKVDKSSRFAIIKACVYTVPDMLFASAIPRLLRVLFTLAKPLITRDILEAISMPHVPDHASNRLIKATALIYLAFTASDTWAQYTSSTFSQSLTATLTAIAYKKCLALTGFDSEPAMVNTIMSSDIRKTVSLLLCVVADLTTAALVVHCVAHLAGSSGLFALLTLVPAIVAAKFMIDIHNKGFTDRSEWRRAAGDHVTFVSNVLSQLKNIKMLGLGSALSKVMKQHQQNEILTSLPVLMAESASIAAGAFAETVIPAVAVGVALFAPGTFRAANTGDFITLVGFSITLADMIGTTMRGFGERLASLDAAENLRDFLLKKETHDQRVCYSSRLLGVAQAPPAVSTRGRRRQGRYPQTNNHSLFVVQFIDVSLTFGEEQPVLKNLSLRIPRGKVTMITGSLGCGKTTFLRAIIGQTKLICGSLLIASTSVAYCAERPWIKNITIRDNIVGESSFDRAWLNLVLYVCALDIDLARLPNGDLTMAGSDGCNLSGGQKQRVAFARALYARKEIIVVDDIFADLDKNTSSAIRIRLFGESEILSANNMTLIMSTSLKEHTVDADLVFEISEDGEVRERSLANREASPSYAPSNMRVPELGTNGENIVLRDDDDTPPVEPVSHLQSGSTFYNVLDHAGGKGSDFSLYKFFYSGPAGSIVSSIFCSLILTAAIAELLPGIFIYFWIVTDPDNLSYMLVYAGFCLANPILNHFCKLSSYYLIYPRTARALYAKVADAIHGATLDHLMSTDTNFLLNKFTQDVSKTTDGLPRLIVPFAWSLADVAIYCMAFYWASSSFLFPAFLAVCQLGVSYFYRKAMHEVGLLHGEPRSELSKLVNDTSKGSEHIHAFSWHTAYLQRFRVALGNLDQLSRHSLALNAWSVVWSGIVPALAAVGTAIFALKSEDPSRVAVGFAYISLMSFGPQIHILAITFGASDAALEGAHQIRAFIQATPQESEPEEYEPVPVDWPRLGKIQLSSVTAQYRPIGAVRHTALDHVSFCIQPGHIVGISGRTGSGKTSIFLAILNLLEYSGRIDIDDRDIRSIPPNILRSRITTMTQSGLELKGSIRLNINPFDPALRPRKFILTDDMLIGILRRVGLWNRIQARGGLDSPFYRMKFSNGQKELFYLARAMLHRQMMRTRIILIDEGARNVEVEDHIRQVMREVFAGCTILMVSHRPSLFREADRIVTVDRGQTSLYEHDREQDRWSASIPN